METGGTLDCSKIGLSGELGCHQFLKSTWEEYSIDIFGYVAEQTQDNAHYVTEEKIYRWLAQGLEDREIFLIWNSGNTRPCRAGINRFGVPYDSCAYVEKAMIVLQEVINR